MPIMTGTQLAKNIRELQNMNEIDSNTKIVLLSGDYKPFKNNEAYLFDDILVKPLKMQDLKKIINKNELLPITPKFKN